MAYEDLLTERAKVSLGEFGSAVFGTSGFPTSIARGTYFVRFSGTGLEQLMARFSVLVDF